jgi:hypothetical protein
VLGEDDGLEDLQARYGMYAHLNERHFVANEASAIVLIAHSVGSYCELGMFADRLAADEEGVRKDFILITDEQFVGATSYFNLGPAKVVADHWIVYPTDFDNFELNPLIARLKGRRAILITDRRGRLRNGGADGGSAK